MEEINLDEETERAYCHIQNILYLTQGETDKEFRESIDRLVSSWNEITDYLRNIKLKKISDSVCGVESEFEKK